MLFTQWLEEGQGDGSSRQVEVKLSSHEISYISRVSELITQQTMMWWRPV